MIIMYNNKENIKLLRNKIRLYLFNKEYIKAMNILEPLLNTFNNEIKHEFMGYYKICYTNTINISDNINYLNHFY